MGHIGTVESLALLDKCFRPDHFFWRAQANRASEHVIPGGIDEPFGVNSADAVASTKDHIDVELAAVGLAEPMWERYVGLVSSTFKRPHRPWKILGLDEHVKVPGVALDTCISGKCVRAADQHVELRLPKHAKRAAIEVPGDRVEDVLWVDGRHRV
jgi:hypothetical protein